MYNPKHKWVFSDESLDNFIPSISLSPITVGVKKESLMVKI